MIVPMYLETHGKTIPSDVSILTKMDGLTKRTISSMTQPNGLIPMVMGLEII